MTKIIVTPEEVKENMKDYIAKTEIEFGKPVTYVSVRMKNGFTIRESTTCVDPKNYNEETGIKICLEKIEDKVWAFLGYALQDKQSKKEADKPCDTFVDRLYIELEELQEKQRKLNAFFDTNTFQCLPVNKKTLLQAQHGAMLAYSSILIERIRLEEESK